MAEASHISDSDVAEAALILKSARLWERNPPGNLLRGHIGQIAWGSRENESKAFALYNKNHPHHPFSVGCMPCHAKVFNWLLSIAFKDVQVVEDPPASDGSVSIG